jgi:hypothetical protein
MAYPRDMRLLDSCAREVIERKLQLPHIAKVDIFLGTNTLKKGAIVVLKAISNDVIVSGLLSQLPNHVEQASIGQLAWDTQGGLAALVLIDDHDAHATEGIKSHVKAEAAGSTMKRAVRDEVSISAMRVLGSRLHGNLSRAAQATQLCLLQQSNDSSHPIKRARPSEVQNRPAVHAVAGRYQVWSYRSLAKPIGDALRARDSALLSHHLDPTP